MQFDRAVRLASMQIDSYRGYRDVRHDKRDADNTPPGEIKNTAVHKMKKILNNPPVRGTGAIFTQKAGNSKPDL